MISVFTIAQDMLKKGTVRELRSVFNDLPPSGTDTVLDERFQMARQQEHQLIAKLEHERGRENYQAALAKFFHPYELPQQPEHTAETAISETQMHWGARRLLQVQFEQHASRKTIPRQKIRDALDRLQMFCAVVDMAEFRAGNSRAVYSLAGKIDPVDTPAIIRTYNDILGRAYGFGPAPVLRDDGGYPRPVNWNGNTLHDILRIEKFDRLRKKAPLL